MYSVNEKYIYHNLEQVYEPRLEPVAKGYQQELYKQIAGCTVNWLVLSWFQITNQNYHIKDEYGFQYLMENHNFEQCAS